MTTIVPIMWIAISAGVLVLGAGLWWWLRRGHGDAAEAPQARTAFEDAGQLDASAAPARAASAAPGAAADPGIDPFADPALIDLDPVPDAAILARLCELAFAGRPVNASATATPAVMADAAAVLARIDAHPRYTPRRPHLLPQLTRAINDPAAGAHAIATILGQDPALAGNLLRIANSVVYRRHPEPIENLERAVALLGTEGLRQIVLAALLQPVIVDDGSVFGRCAAVLWEHTLLSAHAAAQVPDREDANAAQLLALLCGLGAVAVVQVLRDVHARHAEAAPTPAAMTEMLEAWSAHCAKAISADWGLSPRVQRVLEEQASDADVATMSALGLALRRHRAAAAAQLAVRYRR
ncbi:HDOD domain-containing protein [Xanthomonas sp. CFBP 8445]|uniref:HDOD domain-containing protein n=1 Tax=Xanthomonas sp. CFBP 8445 TaxID=2971236 RepID=UPI0021E08F69|nr:HDOD domain-containing protein [Xanthomonas sp. CFBP 8445]UYC10951.1 HDOD domain-containing protein [Xanthomonas sp. CFBP 8445]